MKQKTLSKEIEFNGIGLHTGNQVQVKIKPADINFGIRFLDLDSENPKEFKADVNQVDSTNRGTFLKSGNSSVATVEHILAALSGAGIDNALIEVKGREIPIMDGSAKQFSDNISTAGLSEQEADKNYLIIEKHIDFIDETSGASYTLLPSDQYELLVTIDYNSEVIAKQFAQWDESQSFEDELSSAKTFVFAQELVSLLAQNLIKGGDISNAIIYSDSKLSDEEIADLAKAMKKGNLSVNSQGILNNVELKFDNEAARHKLLDLIGDLSLIGAKIKGKIIAHKPGHTGNVALAKMLKKELQKQRKLGGRPIYSPETPVTHTIEDIKKLIPHRYPFLMVDKIIKLTETEVVGIKNVTFNEDLFNGHFPGNPVFPGVLQMEALAQTGGILALSTVEEPEKYDTYFLKMDQVKFKQKVVPGDTMILKMELLSPIRRGLVHMKGRVFVGDTIVSEGELTAQIVKSR